MLEVITFLVAAIFFTSLVSLYQHYKGHKVNDKTNISTKARGLVKAKNTSNDLWLLEQGYIEKNKIYNVISQDSGRTWYVIEHGVTNPPKLDHLEARHTQVLMHPKAWLNLKNYVKENGPVSLHDQKGIYLLEKAGFEVRIRGH